jgi:glycosyltransferase involved in cell wall biosynthesis
VHKDRALLIIGQDMNTPHHHRGQHLAEHLAKRYASLDLVSITKMHNGAGTDPVWKKGLLGLRDMICKPIATTYDRNIVHHVVRFPYRPALLDYLFRDLWMYAKLKERLKEHYDLCILASPRLSFLAMKLKRQERLGTFIYDDWDYFPGWLPSDPFWRHVMRYRESLCVRNSDAVVSVSSCLRELRKKQGARYTALVPNGVNYALFDRAHHKKPHPPTMLYTGSLLKVFGADLPIRALQIIKRQIPEVRYLILGMGADESRLKAIAASGGVQNSVHFLGHQEYEKLPDFLAESDIGVATSRNDDFRKYACPLKIIEYMAGGLPVIGTRVGETKIIIEKSKAGEAIDFSAEAFANAAIEILSSRDKYEMYSANATNFAREYDWERLLDQELAFIDQLP